MFAEEKAKMCVKHSNKPINIIPPFVCGIL